MLDVHDLHKAYGPVQALRGVSFAIGAGEIVGLLGPNGAGKTTIIKTVTGYLQPDRGRVRVDGLDIVTQTQAAQTRIGYLPESAPLYPELSVQAYLQMMAGLRGISSADQRAYLSEAIYAAGLENHLTRPIGQLSKGYRQRVGLAQAILHKPRLLILDEPTVGLDPTQIVEIRRLIKRLAQSSTVLFSTHILPEVEALCDRVLILMNGELKLDAHLDDLGRNGAAPADLVLVLDDAAHPGRIAAALRALDGTRAVQVEQRRGHVAFRVRGEATAELGPAVFRLAAEQGWPVRELRRDAQTLESIFNALAVQADAPVGAPE